MRRNAMFVFKTAVTSLLLTLFTVSCSPKRVPLELSWLNYCDFISEKIEDTVISCDDYCKVSVFEAKGRRSNTLIKECTVSTTAFFECGNLSFDATCYANIDGKCRGVFYADLSNWAIALESNDLKIKEIKTTRTIQYAGGNTCTLDVKNAYKCDDNKIYLTANTYNEYLEEEECDLNGMLSSHNSVDFVCLKIKPKKDGLIFAEHRVVAYLYRDFGDYDAEIGTLNATINEHGYAEFIYNSTNNENYPLVGVSLINSRTIYPLQHDWITHLTVYSEFGIDHPLYQGRVN
ncbi:MAG: hypothetical protein MJ220_04035 [Bacilli bacterium]|nr:hypothetical protein [Bacilli bacterium]